MKIKLSMTLLACLIAVGYLLPQEDKKTIKLPKLSVEQKWDTAEGNLVYFIISGISYAKSKGETADDFGTWAGTVGCPYWKQIDSMTPAKFVQEISSNEQQFKDYQMEIVDAGKSFIKGRMKGFGKKWVTLMSLGGVTEDDYARFFNKKWAAIANCLGYKYKEDMVGEWTYFTVSKKE
jgi:hypothetical protein